MNDEPTPLSTKVDDTLAEMIGDDRRAGDVLGTLGCVIGRAARAIEFVGGRALAITILRGVADEIEKLGRH